jgi:NADH:ubiquinone oxidoreductase subunit 3 (subunit A)
LSGIDPNFSGASRFHSRDALWQDHNPPLPFRQSLPDRDVIFSRENTACRSLLRMSATKSENAHRLSVWPHGSMRYPYSLPFSETYLSIPWSWGWVALLFILFDLEIVFMYPWAVVYKEMIVESKLIFWSMLSFISILMVGYTYALKKGALDFKK